MSTLTLKPKALPQDHPTVNFDETGPVLSAALKSYQRAAGGDIHGFTVRAVLYLTEWIGLSAPAEAREFLRALAELAGENNNPVLAAARRGTVAPTERLLAALRKSDTPTATYRAGQLAQAMDLLADAPGNTLVERVTALLAEHRRHREIMDAAWDAINAPRLTDAIPSQGDLNLAQRVIDLAEADLGTLSPGQRRDLLLDNTPWPSDHVHRIVNMLPAGN